MTTMFQHLRDSVTTLLAVRPTLGIVTLFAIASGSTAPSVFAATAQADPEATIDEVVVTGTRSKPRSSTQSTVPIDTFNSEQLNQQPHGDLTETLKNLVPSFAATPLTGDGSAFVRSTSLRGLPPDEVLLLVNSKRRHRSSIIQHFGAAMSQGAHAADMGPIPSIALKNVEVLRDGAAAQYGSDAIAGVINFILRDDAEGGSIEAEYGQFNEGEEVVKLAGNIGLPLTDAGFANFSFEYSDSEQLSRGIQTADGQAAIDAGISGVGRDSPYSTDSFAQTWGRPENDGIRTAWNLGIDLGNGAEAYMFGNYADVYGNYRFFYREVMTPSDPTALDGSLRPMPIDPTDPSMGNFCWCDTLTAGFTPYLEGEQTDFSNVVGVRGSFENGLLYDFSGSYGTSEMEYKLNNTLSPTYGPESRRNFHPGDLAEWDINFNADFSYAVNDAVNVAFGAEWREETYEMKAGDEQSWVPGPYSQVHLLIDPTTSDFYDPQPNGSNGLPGTPADSAGEFSRRNYAVYTDVEWDVSDRLLLQGALRFEDFSDFGTTTNGKVAARFNVTDSFTLRGAASTGFRAPTPGQSNLETIVLTFDTADGSQALEGTLRPTDSLLRPLGGQALDPEEATNLSIGFTADIGESFTLTGDYYKVDVEDRIVKTFNIDVSGDPSFANSEFDLVAFYTNGLETETEGFDIIAIYYVDWADSATTFSLAWNHNKTEVTKQNSVLAGGVPVNPVSAGTVFNIQNNLPEDRFSFTANHTMERITLTLRANWYDETIDERNDREKVDSGMVVDIEGRYMVTDNLTVVLGANNVLDEFPNKISTRRSQGLEYPRRTPIGYDGAMWYLKGVWEF